MDGNNQIYPIAWAVVSVENKENWTWFMKCLIEDLGIDAGAGLTIISDQHKVIVVNILMHSIVFINVLINLTLLVCCRDS